MARTVGDYVGTTEQVGRGPCLRHARALRRIGYDVEVLDDGCCGLAGSFGYEDAITTSR